MAIDPRIKAFLDAIAVGESGGKYDVIHGGKRITDLTRHPKERVRIGHGPNAGGFSTAAGKYQITGPTWDDYAAKAGAKDFSPGSQDAVAAAIASDRYKRATGRDLATDLASGNVSGAATALQKTWVSLPGGTEQNSASNNFYANYAKALGGNAAPTPAAQQAAQVRGAFRQAKQFDPRGINPQLLTAMRNAAQANGFNVEVYSGYRGGDKRLHGKGMAVDARLYDPSGKMIPNYQDPKSFAPYQRYAHQVHAELQKIDPKLAAQSRWGGYFSGGKGKYGALDLMHFDLGGGQVGMAGGSWQGGLTPKQAKIWNLQPGAPQGAPVQIAQQAAKQVAAAPMAAGQQASQMAAQQAASQQVASQLAQQQALAASKAAVPPPIPKPAANPFGGLLSMMMMAANKPPSEVVTNVDSMPGIGGVMGEQGSYMPPMDASSISQTSGMNDGKEEKKQSVGHTKKADNRKRRIYI